MNCPECGNPIHKGHRYCSYCDYELSAADFRASQKRREGSLGKGLLIIIPLILLTIGGVILLSGYLLKRSDDGESISAGSPTYHPISSASIVATPETTIPPTAAPTVALNVFSISETTQTPVLTAFPTQESVLPDEPVLFTGTSLQDLAGTLLKMQGNGASVLRIDNPSLTENDINTIFRMMPSVASWNYWYTGDRGDNYCAEYTIEWYPGVRIWHAVVHGRENILGNRDRQILQSARFALDTCIRPGMTDLEKELALHDFIIYNCDYLIDEAGKSTDSVYGFFEHGACQCSGYADTMFLLGRLAGLEIYHHAGNILEDGEAHAWNLIRLDGLWYMVDTCWDDPIGGGNETWLYLNVPLNVVALEREWDNRTLPEGHYASELDDKWYYSYLPSVSNTEEAIQALNLQLTTGDSATVLVTDLQAFDPILAAEGVGYRAGKTQYRLLVEKEWIAVYSVWYE